jgi:hypothetical protein
MAEYKYVGDGVGVPGLPHEISDEEAEQLGVVELLKAAIENGSYESVEQKAEGGRLEPDASIWSAEEILSEQTAEEPASSHPDEKPTKKRKE